MARQRRQLLLPLVLLCCCSKGGGGDEGDNRRQQAELRRLFRKAGRTCRADRDCAMTHLDVETALEAGPHLCWPFRSDPCGETRGAYNAAFLRRLDRHLKKRCQGKLVERGCHRCPERTHTLAARCRSGRCEAIRVPTPKTRLLTALGEPITNSQLEKLEWGKRVIALVTHRPEGKGGGAPRANLYVLQGQQVLHRHDLTASQPEGAGRSALKEADLKEASLQRLKLGGRPYLLATVVTEKVTPGWLFLPGPDLAPELVWSGVERQELGTGGCNDWRSVSFAADDGGGLLLQIHEGTRWIGRTDPGAPEQDKIARMKCKPRPRRKTTRPLSSPARSGER